MSETASRKLSNVVWTQAGIAGIAAILAVVAWIAALVTSGIDRDLELRQAKSQAAQMSQTYEGQVYRQVSTIDQTLKILQLDFERDPTGLDLAALQRRTHAVSDVVAQMLLLDARGRVVTGTRGDLIDADDSHSRYFQVHRRSVGDGAFISGPVQANGQWVLNVSRRLNGARGTFAGVLVAAYDLTALMRDMSQADLGSRGEILLLGRDGVVRASAGRTTHELGENIASSALFRAMAEQPGGSWEEQGARDGIDRIFAFQTVAGLDMTVAVGLDRRVALAPADMRESYALLVASFITLLLVLVSIGLGSLVGSASQREQSLANDRMVLSAANEQLAEAREQADSKSLQLQTTLAGMSDGVSMFDPDLRLAQWNSHFPELAGVPKHLLRVGLPFEAMLRAQAAAGEFGSVDIDVEVARRMALIRSGTGSPSVQRSRPNGRIIELRRTILPEGGCVTLYSDITARAAAEVVQQRAREQAEQAAQEKSRFVAIVSHEIRTPLNVAINAMGLLDRSPLSPAQRQLVETGMLAGDALALLLNDILDLSRMQVGRLALRPAPFALRQMMEGIVDMFRFQAAERGIALSFWVGPDVPDQLLTDGARLRQILMNLVGNAVKFADPGPASIEAMLNPGQDGPGLDGLRLAVFDSGPEIPDLERARLFRPFSQLERQGVGGGTGLGLAVCQLLSNLLGGQIGCEASPGGGKAFWLTLPSFVMEPGAALPAAPPDAVRWVPRTRVLLVEDVPANQLIVSAMLRQEGHCVDIAGSGKEALTMVERRPYDLVLMDIFMPGMDGLATARRMLARGGPAFHPPIVALTANVSPGDLALYREAGMVGMIAKPVGRAALQSALAQHVWSHPITSHPAPERAIAGGSPGMLPVFDQERVVDWQHGLSPLACADLMQDCVAQLRDMLPALHDASATADASGFARVTHTMIGVAGSYGFQALEHAIAAARTAGPGDNVLVQAVGAEVLRLEHTFRASMGMAVAA